MSDTPPRYNGGMNNIEAFPQTLTSKQAIEIVKAAMAEHGSPTWVAFVPSRIRRMVPGALICQMIEATKNGAVPEKRADKYEAIYAWAAERIFEQVSPKQIMEIGNISYPTALKLIENRPDIFRKIKNGVYEIRDPQADRKAVK